MSDFIFNHFSPISAKAWKQKIQYLLQGKSYESLIHTNLDGIATLPFYNQENRNPDFSESIPKCNKQTFSSYFCIVNSTIIANKEALEAQKTGVDCLYFAIFDANLDFQILLQNITIKIYLQCYFLENDFFKNKIAHLLPQKKIRVIYDVLGKISKTGNWFFNFQKDTEIVKKEIKNPNSTISINTSLFHNAGANKLQQIAYGLAQYKAYAEKEMLAEWTSVIYLVSVDTDLYHETAKLKTLRLLHQQLATEYNLNPNCEIIQLKSKRNLSAIHSELNQICNNTEKHIAMLAGANVVTSMPKNFTFYKEEERNVSNICENLIANINNFNNYCESNIYIEKIIASQKTKVLEILDTIQKGGGYIQQLKKGSIQKKIQEQETTQTKHLENQIIGDTNKLEISVNKTPIAYPFLKRKKRKTLWQPIIEKQWRTNLELDIWETHFGKQK